MEAPSSQTVERCNNDDNDNEKVCRICLEDDHPQHMIAPCHCKGSSQWVHRECLDLWRTNEPDRAFANCTECLFHYHLQPIRDASTTGNTQWRRRAQFYMLVSRDICVATIALQVVIASLGALTYLFDSEQNLPPLINENHPVVVYYLFGWLLLLIVLGCYGSITLCCSDCSPAKAMPALVGGQQQSGAADDHGTPEANSEQRGSAYRERSANRERSAAYRQRRHRHNNRSCCQSGPCHSSGYTHHPVYMGDVDGCCCCCCCSNHRPNNNNCNRHNNNNNNNNCNGNDCCNCHCPDAGGDCGDAACVCFLILLVLGIIMAVIGFFVGILLTVVACQRIVQSHVYLVHKRQLVQEFQVMDLSGYDLEQPSTKTTTREEEEEIPVVIADTAIPPAPPLAEADTSYLRKLGLMEQN